MIIDVHTHVFPPAVRDRRESLLSSEPAFAEIYSNAAAEMGTAGELLQEMDRAGVDRSIICNFAWHDDALIEETNEYILGAAHASKGRLIPFVSVSVTGASRHGGPDAEEAVGERKADARTKIRQLASDGARGIGELRPASSGYNLANSDEGDLLNWAASAFDLALLVHASEPVGHHYAGKHGGPLDGVAGFAQQAQAVTVIAAHWGGGLPFYLLMPELRAALSNVYFDTAASHLLYEPAVYRRVIDLAGLDHVLWGSDWPLTSQSNALDHARAAGLTDAELAAILGENAARMLGLS